MRLGDLDALKKEFIKEFYTAIGQGEDSFDVIGTMAKVIDNAPTVEPFEPDYVGAERLKARQRGYEEGYHNGMEIGKTLNPKIKQGEWIPVSERLPEEEGFYLVFLENEQMLVAHSSGIIANHDFEPKMLAWQPLPEPYKEGGAE